MEDKNIHIKFDQEKEVKELIIREGSAAAPNNPIQPIIQGDINAVINFLLYRESTLDKNKAVIYFNEVDGSIILVAEPSNSIGLKVLAKSEIYPDLQKFCINQEKFFGLRELEKHVRMNRFHFADKEAHMKFLADLKSFHAKVSSEIQNEADQRGNKNQTFKKVVTSDLAADFVLRMPLFKGLDDSTFRVEVCYDVTDSAVRFWMESVELMELQKDAIKKAFVPQWGDFVAKEFTCINQ